MIKFGIHAVTSIQILRGIGADKISFNCDGAPTTFPDLKTDPYFAIEVSKGYAEEWLLLMFGVKVPSPLVTLLDMDRAKKPAFSNKHAFGVGQLVSADTPGGYNYPWVYEVVGPVNPVSRSSDTIRVRNFTNGSNTYHTYCLKFLTPISNEEAIRRLTFHRDNRAIGKNPPGTRPKKPFNFEERMQELNEKL
jgi:hypothetical protein